VQAFPDAGRLPVPQPPPAGRAAATAQLLRQEPPGTPRPEDEDDAAEGRTVWDPRPAAIRLRWLLRQQGFDGFPEIVGNKGLAHGAEASGRPVGFCNTLLVL
jgi:hypothetical protein